MSDENQGWQSPQPPVAPEDEVKEQPQMSLMQTLTDIFFSPAEVFEDLRKGPFPRLIFPFIICALLVPAYQFALSYKLGQERIVQEQLKMPIMERLPDEAKKKMLEDAKNASPVRLVINSVIGIVAFLVIFSIMGLIYWAGGLAFGGQGGFWHGLAVVAYSSFPIILISMIGSLIILLLKSPDDISFMDSQNGLLRLNPNLFLDTTGALKALFSRIDLLAFWGVFLGAVGMKNCMRVSNGGAWLFSIIIWLIGTTVAVIAGYFFS
jgi:hypothetical protein